jgi:hypothetical protein
MHRINLLDHVKVHFPNDTIDAITKSVLPKWHVVHQLLMPHFWLTLPVNNAVLEGPLTHQSRHVVPWNPFAAKGKGFPEAAAVLVGRNEYYHPGTKNSAFPRTSSTSIRLPQKRHVALSPVPAQVLRAHRDPGRRRVRGRVAANLAERRSAGRGG